MKVDRNGREIDSNDFQLEGEYLWFMSCIVMIKKKFSKK